jgi:Flp pilus assembly protein CpaB
MIERGSLVDVLAILEKDDTMNTKVIAQAVRVLAVDDRIAKMEVDKNEDTTTMEVVLLVSPKDADWIVYSMNHGNIELVVRNDRAAIKTA